MPKVVPNQINSMRLDKWLWCARFFKTRRLATEAINSGKVKVAGDRVKSARLIKTGDKIMVKKSPYDYQLTIIVLVKNRKSAKEATLLYEEELASIEKRQLTIEHIKTNNARFPKTKGRPNKKERREIVKFRSSS